MKYFYPKQKSLIFIQEKASPDFWDRHWQADPLADFGLLNPKAKNLFVEITAKYLKKEDGFLLEGGCGNGKIVLALKNKGFQVIGIDFAKETILKAKEAMPQGDFRLGDVRELAFENNFFAGYLSLGVIEHFFEGYSKIAREAQRVIKPKGYLFLSFPYLSLLRKIKVKLGFYHPWQNDFAPNDFYQFALNKNKVINDFNALGFKKIKTIPFNGLKGFKEEIGLLPQKKKSENHLKSGAKTGDSKIIFYLKRFLDFIFKPFASHGVLLVLQKQ